jgi:GxxExxY protein
MKTRCCMLAVQGQARSQVPLSVRYKGHLVGQYVADVLVEDSVLLELKAQQQLPASSEAQLTNYLHASGRRIGMLINFTSPKAAIKRFVV